MGGDAVSRFLGILAGIWMVTIDLFFAWALVDIGQRPLEWGLAAAHQVFSLVILLAAVIASTTLTTFIWRNVWNSFRSQRSRA